MNDSRFDEFAFECALLGVDLDSYAKLLESANDADKATLEEAQKLARAAYEALEYELFKARVELMFYKAVVFEAIPLAKCEHRVNKGRRLGNAIANAARAKLPAPDVLAAELTRMIAAGTDHRAAKAWLCRRYNCTSQALGQKLKKAKPA